jgi:hypothetical protein
MSPRDWFGLVVRLAAMIFAVYAGFDLVHLIGKVIGIDTESRVSLGMTVLATVCFAGFAAIGLLRAEWFVDLTYGPGARRDPE